MNFKGVLMRNHRPILASNVHRHEYGLFSEPQAATITSEPIKQFQNVLIGKTMCHISSRLGMR